MTVYKIPLDADDSHFGFSVDLDGSLFSISFYWVEREGAWYCSLAADDNDATPIVSGWRVCVPGLLTRRAYGVSRPAGELLFVDIGETNTDPGRYDLGVRIILLYYDEASMAELVM